jgi:quercetin dioxygenase-like cupin family protein
MTVVDWDARPRATLLPGIVLQAVRLDGLMLARIAIDPGVEVPEHAHPHEQIGTILAGSLTLRMARTRDELRPGTSYAVPGGERHGATAGPEGCLVLEAFAPVREDYAALLG